MIPFDFEYYRPDSIKEAVDIFSELEGQNKSPLYYSGGTEIITMARKRDITTGAVIDIKGIPECRAIYIKGGELILGTALTLTEIAESNLFPLLSDVARGTADHTARDKITLGGNICGRIIYRETVLPLLLCESTAVTAGVNGLRYIPFSVLFNEKLQLQKGEMLVQVKTGINFMSVPYINVKKTKIGKIDYPLVSIAALKNGSEIRMALSGMCGFPFRSKTMEEDINLREISMDERIDRALSHLPCKVLNNISGSDEYRKFVLKNTLKDILTALEGM